MIKFKSEASEGKTNLNGYIDRVCEKCKFQFGNRAFMQNLRFNNTFIQGIIF